MRMPTSRQLMIVIAGCGGVALLVIALAALAGAVAPAAAAGLALGAGGLGGVLVLGLWIRRLDGKVQRLSDRLAREAVRPRPAPVQPRPDPRLDRVEAAVTRLGGATDRLEERVGAVLATLGEDRVEAVYRLKHYTDILTEMAADLHRIAENAHGPDEDAVTVDGVGGGGGRAAAPTDASGTVGTTGNDGKLGDIVGMSPQGDVRGIAGEGGRKSTDTGRGIEERL